MGSVVLMLESGSGDRIKRPFTTSVVIFERTLSSASTLSDSLPVCRMERLPTPLSSTSSKPFTSLDSLSTLPDPSIVPLVSSVPPEEETTTCCEETEDEEDEDEDTEDEEVEEEMLPLS